MYTLAKLKEAGFKARVLLVCVVDEESGASSELGLKYLLQNNFLGNPKGAIYAYPGQTITIGHRGLLRLIIEVNGESVHSGSTQWATRAKGAHAVLALAEIILEIEQHEWPKDLHSHFTDLKLEVTPGTVFNGGSFESVVPSNATAIVDVRLMPLTLPDEIISTIQSIINKVIEKRNKPFCPPRLSASLKIKNKLPAVTIDENHKLVQCCKKAVKQIIGVDTVSRGCGPANEGYMLVRFS